MFWLNFTKSVKQTITIEVVSYKLFYLLPIRKWSGQDDYLGYPLCYIYKRNGKSTIRKIKKIPQTKGTFTYKVN